MVRTLLRTIDNSTSGSRAIKEVLRQASDLSQTSLALLVDVLQETLTTSTLAPSLFIKEFRSNIYKAQRRNAKQGLVNHNSCHTRKKECFNRDCDNNNGYGEDHDMNCGLTPFDIMVLLVLFRHPQHSHEVNDIIYLCTWKFTHMFCCFEFIFFMLSIYGILC